MSRLLYFIELKDLENWSVGNYLANLIKSKYDIVSLKEYIQEEKQKIKPFNFPEEDFKILGVNNKIGLFDNEIKKGKEINQPYKTVENDFLAFNPYRINVGSIGIKSNKQNYNLISSAYVVFSCNKFLLPTYLFLIFKTQTFNQIIRENTRGSVRQILAFDILKNLKIPLPDLSTQQKILKNYNDKINLAKQQEEQAKQKEQEIEEYLYRELGIEKVEEEKKEGLLQFVWLSNLNEWGFEKQNIFKFNSKYRTINLDDCCRDFKNGVNFTKSQFGKGIKFVNIKDLYTNKFVNLNKLDRIDIDEKEIKENQLKDNDLVFVRSSVKYEGVGFPSLIKLKDKDEKITFCGFIIKCSINTSVINPSFLLWVLRCERVRRIVIENSNKSTITNISQPKLKKLKIPLPPLEIQNRIAEKIQNLKNEIENLKTQAEENRQRALEEFEKEVF